MWYYLCVWFISLNVRTSTSIHSTANDRIAFYLTDE
jgi:hypothetical protein